MAKHTPDPGARKAPVGLVGVLALIAVVVVGLAAFLLTRGGGADDPVAGPESADDQAVETTGAPTPEDSAATSSAPQDCSPVTVWASPEVLPAVEGAAERARTDCFTYKVVEQEDTVALASLQDESVDVWVPESAAWAHLAAADGIDLTMGEPLASSPVLLVTSPETVSVLEEQGLESSTFAEIAQAHQELVTQGDSPFSLRVGDARVDPATMALLASTRGQAGGWADDSDESREILVRLAQTAAQGDPLAAVLADPTTVVPATERQLSAAEPQDAGLQGVALAEGGGVVRVPFVTLVGTGSADAVDALEQELRSDEASGDFQSLGLRFGAEGEGPSVAAVPADVTTEGEDPSRDDVAATAETWAAVAPESRILTVVDISGSMEAEIGDTTRIDLARTAIETAISAIPDQTTMGLWYFATALEGNQDHAEQVPLRPLAEELDNGRTQEETLLRATRDLGLETLTGDTGLHDALWAAYDAMRTQQTADSISTVLLLTDGINDDSTGGLSEDEVVERLTEAHQGSDAPVNVVLIGMGPDVDESALERLATAAGGESRILRDPRELPQVFVDVVADRAP